jgi:O-acetylhomoserine (thiol)-lyase
VGYSVYNILNLVEKYELREMQMGFNTELLHGTKTGDPHTGATLTPVYQSSAFFQPSAEQHEKLFHNKANGYSYTRINNPTIAAFEERMTVLEKGVASVACASGMAALTNALLNIVGSGQEIIASTSLYGGTIDLFHDLEAFGIKTILSHVLPVWQHLRMHFLI